MRFDDRRMHELEAPEKQHLLTNKYMNQFTYLTEAECVLRRNHLAGHLIDPFGTNYSCLSLRRRF